MKARKISILVAVFVIASLLLASTAFAAAYKCTVNRVGSTTTSYIVYLTSDTSAWSGSRWFRLPKVDKQGKEFLAIALTAYANGKKLQVTLATVDQGTEVSAIYILD